MPARISAARPLSTRAKIPRTLRRTADADRAYLNNLIPPGSRFTLDNATAINDNGQIVANGTNSTGQEHAFLLTPG